MELPPIMKLHELIRLLEKELETRKKEVNLVEEKAKSNIIYISFDDGDFPSPKR
jgi:hypothetical protein